MSFAAPVAFFAAVLAIPIVVFYILKVRLRRLPTSTTMFWDQIYDERPPRSLTEILKHLLSLLAQLALLTLLLLALADPFFPWQAKNARHIVLIIDPSASMQVFDGGETRFEQAIQQGLTISDGLRFHDEMTIVLAGEHPSVVCGMTGHIPTLKQTLNRLEPTETPTKLAPSIELGQRLISDQEHGEIVVLTDGCSDEFKDVTLDESTRFHLVGAAHANLGITQFQVRRSLIDPLGYEVLVALRNASEYAAKCRLDVDLNGSPIDVLPLSIEPGEEYRTTLKKTSMDGGELKARITQIEFNLVDGQSAESSRQDGLASDNEAWTLLEERKPQPVVLVTPNNNLFLRKVFEANPLVQLSVYDTLPASIPDQAIVVLHNVSSDSLPDRDTWCITPNEASAYWEVNGDLTNPLVTEIDEESRLMKHVHFENFTIPKARHLTFLQDHHTLAGALTGESLFVEVPRGEHKLLVLAVDIEEGDLTFRTAFPIMATNALSWFANSSGEIQTAYATGRAIEITIPESLAANTRELDLVAPDGQKQVLVLPSSDEVPASSDSITPVANRSSHDLSVHEQATMVGPIDRVGIWTIQRRSVDAVENSASIQFACNLNDERETNLTPSEKLADSRSLTETREGIFTRPLWIYLAAATAILLAIEWGLYQRRWIR